LERLSYNFFLKELNIASLKYESKENGITIKGHDFIPYRIFRNNSDLIAQ